MNIVDENEKAVITFEKFGQLKGNSSSSQIWLYVQQRIKMCCGYINGDVLLYDFVSLKLIYTFRSSDLVTSRNSQSTSIPRVLAFSLVEPCWLSQETIKLLGQLHYTTLSMVRMGVFGHTSHRPNLLLVGLHQGWILGLSFDEEGKHLASCGFDKCIRV